MFLNLFNTPLLFTTPWETYTSYSNLQIKKNQTQQFILQCVMAVLTHPTNLATT